MDQAERDRIKRALLDFWGQDTMALVRLLEKLRIVGLSQSEGQSQPAYERGDYVKVEFPDETTGIGEWMWMVVDHIDKKKRLIFGTLDNDPVNDYGGKIKLGSEMAASYDNIPEYKEAAE